jgi:hypothetical protein
MKLSILATTSVALLAAILNAGAQTAVDSHPDGKSKAFDGLLDIPLPETNLDPDIQIIEDEYATGLIKVRRELGEQYLIVLKRLQDALTVRKQIEQALLVKLERERISELLESALILEAPTAGATLLQEIELVSAKARCAGGTRYDGKKGRIRNWAAAGATATWDIDPETPPGRYEFIVEYAAGNDAGGSFELIAGEAEPVLCKVVTDSGNDWNDKKSMLAGSVVIGPGTNTLSLTCTTLRHTYLWALYSAKLAPQGRWEEMEKIRLAEERDAADASTPPGGGKTPKPKSAKNKSRAR